MTTYHDDMPAPYSARDVAAAIRVRMPGVGIKKLHKLLYYAQAHHLVAFGDPLFRESLSAWDRGPVVGRLWYEEKNNEQPEPAQALDQAGLNTVGYVLSRYGRLTGRDLEVLSHGETPWQEADDRRRRNGDQSATIRPDQLVVYFSMDDDPDDESLPAQELNQLLAGALDRHAAAPQELDDLDLLRDRVKTWRESA